METAQTMAEVPELRLLDFESASRAVLDFLHKRLGFEHCGTIKQAGFKFGRWLDLAFLQKTLATPLQPVDG